MKIAIDFDGTIVTHEYPKIGSPVPLALETMRELQAKGHEIILWTMRSGEQLKEAVHYVENGGIILHGVNENPQQHTWTSSPKAYAHLYIDDAALGCPLYIPTEGRPYVDWQAVRDNLTVMKFL